MSEFQVKQINSSKSVQELLNHEAMHTCRLVAGECGLSRMVRWVHCSDLPDVSFWLKGGELLIHSGSQSRGVNLAHLIRQLENVGAAALAVSEASDIINQEAIKTANELCLPLILIPDEIQFVDLTYAISCTLLEKRVSIALDIEQFWYKTALLAIKDFEATLDYIAQWLNCSLTLFDQLQTPIYTKNSIGFVKKYGNHKLSVLSKNAFENARSALDGFEFIDNGNPRWITPIYVRSSLFGFVVFTFIGALDELNKTRIQHATRLVQMATVISSQASNLRSHLHSDMVREILGDSELSDQDLELRASDIGFNLRKPGRMAIFRPLQVSHDITLPQIENVAAEYLHRGVVMLLHHSDIIFWIPQIQNDNDQSSVLFFKNICSDLQRAIGLIEWKGGIGKTHTGVKGIRLSMNEAEIATRRALPKQFLFFNNLSTWDVLSDHLQKSLPHDTSVAFLSSLTDKEKSRLVETINALVLTDFNLSAAAKTLSLHRNGLTKRLERWVEQIGVDFTNPKNVLAMWAMIQVENNRLEAPHGQ
jgi:purine catabolism regulator